MEQTLVHKVELTPEGLFREVLDPSVSCILIGEDHFEKTHKANEHKVVEKAVESGRPFRLVLENFEEIYAPLFANAYKSAEARADLERMVMKRTTGESHMKYINLALQHGQGIIPIDPFPSEKFDVPEKSKHLTRRLNEMSRDILTIAILGIGNLTHPVFQGRIVIPEGRRKEILQDTEYTQGIFKNPEEPHRYFINREL
jgi:hypothetical protein